MAPISLTPPTVPRGRRILEDAPSTPVSLESTAMAATSNGILITDPTLPDNPIVYCNPAFERLTGYSAAETLGRNCRFLQGKETDAGAVKRLRRALAEERDCRIVIKNYRKDGSEFWNELSISPVRDADGRLTHFVGVQNDITRRREAELRLRRSEHLLAEIQAFARVGHFDYDPVADRALWSAELYKIFGFAPGTPLIGAEILGSVHFEDRSLVNAVIARPFREPWLDEFDYRIVSARTGETRTVHLRCRSVGDESGRLLRIVGTIQDVTDRRRMEAALRSSEARKSAITEAALDAIIAIDHQGRITEFNPAAEKMFGCPRAEAVGASLGETIIPQRLRARHEQGFQRYLAGGESRILGQRIEIEALRADGAEFPAELAIARIPNQEPPEFTGFIRDLTGQRAVAAELRRRDAQTIAHQDVLLELAQRPPGDFEVTLCRLLETDARTLGIERVSYWSMRSSPAAIRCECLYVASSDSRPRGLELHATDYPAYFAALETERLIVANDSQNDPRTSEFTESYTRPLGITSMLDVPVRHLGAFVGVLCHEHVGEPRGWSAEEQKFAISIGHFISLALASQDRLAAEAALRQNEERYRDTFENAGVGIGHLSLTGQWTWANACLCEIAGRTPEELLGATFESLAPPEDRPFAATCLSALLEGKATRHAADHRLLRADGAILWVAFTLHIQRAPGGAPLCFVAAAQDVTDRKRTDERLAEQASLLDLAQDAIFVHGLDDTIRFWSAGAEALYGIGRQEAIGRKVSDLLYRGSEAFVGAVQAIVEHGEWHGELRHTGRAEIIVDARCTLVRAENGEPHAILAIHTDITARKKLEAQMLRAQRMEGIGTLAAGVAHDLNNILSPILMSASMLRFGLEAEALEEIVGMIETSAQRGADIVRQVLTFARGVEGERVLLQPRHLVREIEKIARKTFLHSIAIQNATPSDSWPVIGDATQIHQVLLNLCVNARDAMPSGGTLSLDVENIVVDESYAASAADAQPGPYAVIVVSDTGSGISREAIDKIFDPFFTTKELGKGSGLGLSTVLGIVKSHHGFVTVASEPSRGTTFKVFLPAAPDQQAELPSDEARGPETAGTGQLILIVDDEESIRSVTARLLTQRGYRVVTATDGPEALAIYAQRGGEIAVVLTDVAMPFLDGVTLTRTLRRLNPAVKVIASSGHVGEARHAELAEIGVNAFLAKPFRSAALFETLQGVLES